MKKNITLVIIIIAAVAAILVSAINIKGFSVTESSKKFKQEYESINDKVSEKSSKKSNYCRIKANNNYFCYYMYNCSFYLFGYVCNYIRYGYT